MSDRFKIPWHKYAVIADLARRLKGISPQFGKTALQKIVFLLQEVYKIPLGYNFSFYNYGPYSEELANDLALAEAIGAVSVGYVEDAPGGFQISEGPKAPIIRKLGKDFLREHGAKLSKVVEEFGELSARSLELCTTAFFVAQDLKDAGGSPTAAYICDIVQQLKPRFSTEEIKGTVDDLQHRGLVELDDSDSDSDLPF